MSKTGVHRVKKRIIKVPERHLVFTAFQPSDFSVKLEMIFNLFFFFWYMLSFLPLKTNFLNLKALLHPVPTRASQNS